MFILLLLAALPAWGQGPAMPAEVAKFVRVVDGTGAPARENQTIVTSGEAPRVGGRPGRHALSLQRET